MDRVYESGAAAAPPSQPTSPSTGYPTAGNPQTAVPATKPGPWWYHMITEELRAVIAAAGITPSHTDVSQLSTAIRRLIDGGDYKASVRVATTANITLSGEQTIDGVAVVAGDRVLVKDQAVGSQNGIYVAAVGAWARAADADDGAKLNSGAIVPVESGTANADTIWMLTTDGAITIGTTALVFEIKSGKEATKAGVQQAAYITSEAGGTADAITGTFTPAITALTNGMALYVRAASANATATPTFSPNGLPAKTIVKGNNLPLAAGDIAGAGHWLVMNFDTVLDKWVLQNPADVATTAQAQALSDNWNKITPLRLKEAFQGANQSLAASGYQKLPGGLIIQWFDQVVTNVATNYSFPLAFPTASLKVFLTDGAGDAASITFGANAVSATQFRAICSSASVLGCVLAIGY